MVLEAPQGNLPDSRSKGDETPQGSKSGSRPDTALKPSKVPESGGGPPYKRSKSAVPVAPVQPEARTICWRRSKAHSSHEDEEEEEETSPPPAGGGKKRKAAPTGEAKGSKRGKTPPPDCSTDADDNEEEWQPRAKPLAKS